MGASGWDYMVPFGGSLEESLLAVQESVLASGDFVWPWEQLDFGGLLNDGDEDEALPRPSSLQELSAAKEYDEFWEEGTHTILDMDRVIAPDAEDHDGTVRPLSDQEILGLFSTLRPAVAEFDRIYQPGPAGPLAELMSRRWSARSLLIHDDEGAPVEVFFWGFSGD